MARFAPPVCVCVSVHGQGGSARTRVYLLALCGAVAGENAFVGFFFFLKWKSQRLAHGALFLSANKVPLYCLLWLQAERFCIAAAVVARFFYFYFFV